VILLDKPQSRELLSLGATIASLLQAEIEGVFVEDDRLFRLTGLPFLRELRLESRNEARLDPTRLMREWRAIAKQARDTLEDSATRAGLSWSFRVWRGEYDSDLKQLATNSELLLMASQDALSTRRLSTQAKPSSTATKPLKLGVILDSGMVEQKLLDTITELGQKPDIELILFLPPDEQITTDETLRLYLSQHDPEKKITLIRLADKASSSLAKQLKVSACDLLMISEQSSLLAEPTLNRILEALPYPTVVVRT
jgi:hypothetical protein